MVSMTQGVRGGNTMQGPNESLVFRLNTWSETRGVGTG